MPKISIIEAVEPEHIAQVAQLLRDYLLWMRRRYSDHAEILDAHFDAQRMGERTRRSSRALRRAVWRDRAGARRRRAGGLRGVARHRRDVSEMKRLFVRPAFRDLGIACALVARLGEFALARGYKTMTLETGPLQHEAQALYRGLGFQPVAPYHAVADWFTDNMLFFKAATRDVARHPARRRAPIAA